MALVAPATVAVTCTVPGAWSDAYKDEPDPTKRIYYGSVSLIDHEVDELVFLEHDRSAGMDQLDRA